MSCNICIEKYNKSNRTVIKCKCDFECCKSCAKIFLLSKSDDISCMSCKTQWSRQFLVDNFDKTFINKQYKCFREDVLFERELGLLQATQPDVEKQLKLNNMEQNLKLLNKNLENLKIQISNQIYDISLLKHTNTRVEKKKIVRKCPSNDCHGFLDSSLKCELCNCFSCKECKESIGNTQELKESHVCNKDTLESIKFLEKDSKPCPGCSSLTFKINGCHSMWCIECKTSWHWITGKIETGVIHNPEYFDYQKKTLGSVPRNPEEIICGREINNTFINSLIRKTKSNPIITNVLRETIHLKEMVFPKFANVNRYDQNLKMRVNYMLKSINKNQFKISLQKKEKLYLKNTEIQNLITMYINSITDILFRINNNPRDILFNEITALRIYTNECFDRIGKSYNSKKYKINEKFDFI